MPTVRISEFDGPRTRQGVWLSDCGGACEARSLVFPCLPLPSPGFVGIHRSCGRELSSLSSFDSRFAVLFLPYGACFCRETWNRRLPWSGKPGIDEGRWYEAAGGMSGVVSVACGSARVMSAQRISSSRASRHPFLVRQGGFDLSGSKSMRRNIRSSCGKEVSICLVPSP